MQMQSIEIPGPLERQNLDESHSTDYPLTDFTGKKIIFATTGNKVRFAQLMCNGHVIAECNGPTYGPDWTTATVSVLDMCIEDVPAGLLRMRLYHEPGKYVSLRTGTCT
jgi:hypothetical protein